MTEDEDADANDSADEKPAKKAKTNGRFTPDNKYTLIDADHETDDHRRKIQALVATPNPNSDYGIYVIRPWPAADARQL